MTDVDKSRLPDEEVVHSMSVFVNGLLHILEHNKDYEFNNLLLDIHSSSKSPQVQAYLDGFNKYFSYIQHLSAEELSAFKKKAFGKGGYILTLFNIERNKNNTSRRAIEIFRSHIRDLIEDAELLLRKNKIDISLSEAHLDLTLASDPNIYSPGAYECVEHPITSMIHKLHASIMPAIGFKGIVGPEIDSEDNNFTNLNIPANHPARDMHDTLYTSDKLLRSHTSNTQVRFMMNNGADTVEDVRLYSIGRVYRNDSDSSHSPAFYQMEGFYISENANLETLFADIKKIIELIFDREISLRPRISYFPFTEPSFEIDIKYRYGDNGRLIPDKDGDHWMEILGCGLINNSVFDLCNWKGVRKGYAFGVGIDRLIMLSDWGISDIRDLYSSDIRNILLSRCT